VKLAAWAACLGVAAAAMAALAATPDLDGVMQSLAARRHGRADFVEQKFVSLLKRPVESSGELLYDAPGHLEKRTLLPHRESWVVDGDVLIVERDRHRRELALTSYPEMLPFVESIRATLAGDRSALERLFVLDFTGAAAQWTLTLAPRDGNTARTVRTIRITGANDALLQVEIRQPDGDRSLMTLRPPAHP
jgi:hypothetical protein